MRNLEVFVEIEGSMVHAGTIAPADGGMVFSYEGQYRSFPGAFGLSASLPLSKERFTPEETKNYFDGLLPEGFTRKSVARWMGADENDYLSILAGLGKECLGAVKITMDGENAEPPRYEKLSNARVKALAEEGATKSTELVNEAHLSLTGASGKVGLYLDEEGTWYLPKGSAPSTHIVKQSHIRLENIVTNERLCLLTAARLGIAVPDSFIISEGGTGDGNVLFATKRFDRSMEDSSRDLDGKKVPLRLHQEDFAQALGIPSVNKYEASGEHYLERMFDLLRTVSANPMADQLALWDILAFHYMAGNTDGHLKNFSLLRQSGGKGIRLAPAYDIVSTAVYPNATRKMAMSIGGDSLIGEITMDSFKRQAGKLRLGAGMALERVRELKQAFPKALKSASEELSDLGFVQAGQLDKEILQKGGYAFLK